MARARARPHARLTTFADRRRLAGPLLVELGPEVGVAPAALGAVPRSPLFLALQEVWPAVVGARILFDLDEQTAEHLVDGQDPAQSAAKVVRPMAQIERRRDIDLLTDLGNRGPRAD